MSAPIYFDADVDLSLIQGKRVAVIGYGNQGNAQANNLRDSGVRAIRIGNREDEYKARAVRDGFDVVPIRDAAAWGDVVLLLIPDEVQPEVFREQIGPQLEQMHSRETQSPIGQAEARVMDMSAVHPGAQGAQADGQAQQPVEPSLS